MMLGHRKPRTSQRTAEDQALRWLARKEFSQADLRKKLRDTGYGETATEQAIEACSKRGWQSDRRCAEIILRGGLARGLGPQRIRYELEQRGVASEIIDETLATYAQGWEAHLRQVMLKRMRILEKEPIQDCRGRLIRFLQGRGFALDMILSLIKELDPS